jgi:Domain of unknown function (DUF5753)
VPRLLQTTDYTLAARESARQVTLMPPGEMREHADALGWWVARLTGDAEPPLRVRAVVEESVLHRMVGSGQVMRAQRAHLDEMAARPGVDLRVLPSGGGQMVGLPAFTYLEYPAAAGVDEVTATVLFDRLGVPEQLDGEKATWPYRVAFDHLAGVAESPAVRSASVRRLA